MIPSTAFAGKTVAVFGLGASGNATVRALLAGGATVAAWDDSAASRAGLRPAMQPGPAAAPAAPRGLVQLGAYSSEASARAAWTRLKSGQAAWALDGLSPVYEAVDVGGRSLTRLKVRAPAAGAAAVCAAAGIDDPWCRRAV